jgi:phospholipid N-methyltransferase
MDNIGPFIYIKYKGNIVITKNILYHIVKTSLDNVYEIGINQKLYDRLVKIQNITKIENKTITIIDKLIKNHLDINYNEYLKMVSAQKMSKEIDKRIINDLIKLGLNNE